MTPERLEAIKRLHRIVKMADPDCDIAVAMGELIQEVRAIHERYTWGRQTQAQRLSQIQHAQQAQKKP